MSKTTRTLGVDFGTSNSAIGFCEEGRAQLIGVEKDAQTLPTAVFFDFDTKRIVYGQPAQEALIAGDEGRYMRALKSLLGTALMRESRMLLGKRMDFIAIVGDFLAQMKARAEAATGLTFDRALSGRPVLFHSANERRNAQAEIDLRDCYLAAGFTDVRFMPEPEAAALANRAVLNPGDLGLVVDIGGGTSDFTLFRQQGETEIDILASNGLRLGGTDFDREISLQQVMPLLGRGSQIKHAFGSETHTAPTAIFADLATWQKIPFLYTQDTRRMAADLEKYAVEPDKLARLMKVLEDELGHDLAFAVEAGKIAANDTRARSLPEINLAMLETGLRADLPAAMLNFMLADMAQDIAQSALATVAQANLKPADVTRLIFVGGSSLMGVVDGALCASFPQAQVHRGAALTAIVEGLAIASGTAFE
ncbi:MAG: Hsp70 family protein [Sulfitobacter sp.]